MKQADFQALVDALMREGWLFGEAVLEARRRLRIGRCWFRWDSMGGTEHVCYQPVGHVGPHTCRNGRSCSAEKAA